jgi:hypothetical protein
MHLCSTLFNTRRLREIGGFSSKHNLFQDVLSEAVLAARFGRVDVREVKASFRNHPLQNTSAHHIMPWCEDSIQLLDTICNLVPEDRDLLRTRGVNFFENHNYALAEKIESPFKRFLAHLKIFNMFGRRMAYIRKFVRGRIKRIRSAL